MMKGICMVGLWFAWLLHVILGESTEAAVYTVGFLILLFMPEEKP